MTKEYISKALETESGFEASCWVVVGMWVDLKAGSATLTLEGYKDFSAKEAKKQVMGIRNVTITDFKQEACYNAVRENVLAAVLSNTEFVGGTLESVIIEDIITVTEVL